MKCDNCQGHGIIYYRIPHYERVTRDMAIDACDRSLEGQEIQFGEDDVEEPCQKCNGRGQVDNEQG